MDNQARELSRLVSSGDGEAGVKLAHLGSRASNTAYLSEGLLGCLNILSYDELQKLQHAVAVAITKAVEQGKQEDPRAFGTVKAVEFNLSSLGKVSLGELVASVYDFVDQVRNNQQEAINSPFLHQTQSGYRRKSRRDCIQRAEEVFAEYNGDFFVGSNGALRIYSLKRDLSEEEKNQRKLVIQRKKLEEELQSHEAKRARLLSQLEKQQQKEARLKARIEKMEGADGQED